MLLLWVAHYRDHIYEYLDVSYKGYNKLSYGMYVSPKGADTAKNIGIFINWVAYYCNQFFEEADLFANWSDTT